MKKIHLLIIGLAVFGGSLMMPASASAAVGDLKPINSFKECNKGSFLGLPTWYKYLDTTTVNGKAICNPVISELKDFWLIGMAVIEILLRVAVLAAIGYVMVGGFRYITARGEPEKLTKSRTMIVDALIGLVVAIIATAGVSFVAGRFTQ